MSTDLEIAHEATLLPIQDLARDMGLLPEEVEQYGPYKAKVRLDAMKRLEDRPDGKLVVVSAITPTPLGEGKTVTTVGTTMALARLGKKAITCIRQPSMGPIFGIKGGAAGGGYSQVVPMEDFNLHLTGDIHAIGAAHNLGAAALDSRLYHEERAGYAAFEKRSGLAALRINPDTISWKRVVDINDRAMRQIEIGLPSPGSEKNQNGVPRQTGFAITVASELMAILALANDLQDMRARIGRIVMAENRNGEPLTADDLGVAGAMTAVMRDCIKPTLMQTLEHTPCFVHAGPFANIAHGNSSIIADRMALKLADYVVTESGFGSDMGFEKFANIKARASGKAPDVVVLVATLRALKMHSGKYRIIPGRPLDPGLIEPNPDALKMGASNLQAHIRNVTRHGLPVVVAVNRFPEDQDEELELVRDYALELGAQAAAVSDVHAKGGAGGEDLARAITAIDQGSHTFRQLYPNEMSLREKVETIATTIYGAGRVHFSGLATQQIRKLQSDYGQLPVCMAKTPLSLSHDPKLKGAPNRFEFPVREVRLSAGAGFVYVLAGDVSTMPGLGSRPSYLKIDIDDEGNIVGLF